MFSMMLSRTFILLITFLAVGTAYDAPEIVKDLSLLGVPFDSLPTPGDLAFRLSEDEFEDYLDFWLHERNLYSEDFQYTERDSRADGCSVKVSTLGEPQPVYVSGSALLTPTGTTGSVDFSASQAVMAACPGSGLTHTSTTSRPVEKELVCSSETLFSSSGWLSGTASFETIGCTSHPKAVEATSGSCLAGGTQITVGFSVGSKMHNLMTSCFHQTKAEVFYVLYEQNPDNFVYQSGVDRPSFGQGSFFPGLSVDTLYTQASQKTNFDAILGSGMNLKYINDTYFLARGHMAAKTDYVFSTAQRATFTFLNVAPQWQPFNGGNWNTLEQNLRSRIGEAGSRTMIYTGTWGILQLKNSGGALENIYLSASTNKIPVPMWIFKVVHEPSTDKAIAFLGLNNPHVTEAEAKQLAFCTDVCNGVAAYSWINWKQTNIGMGYSLCCELNDFRKTVTFLPSFTSSGLWA